jgi:uncharacterized repeat protein (TIGR03803 family)
MPSKRSLIVLLAVLVSVSGLVRFPVWAASRQKVIHSFKAKGGSCPSSNLIFDVEGNVYGTTFGDGYQTCFDGNGTVFRLSPGANGKWTKTVLYRFSGKDGANPYAGLTFDISGNLYGTTWIGGGSQACGSGCGTVFKLSPGAGGKWTETVLYSFNGYADGANPYAGLIFDSSGNLYGTTWSGGSYGYGNVFKLAPGADGKWTETVLHNFNGKDGWVIYAGVISDGKGSLYGAAASGGDLSHCQGNGCGSVFQLTPGAGGTWTYTVLHYFDGKDGAGPVGSLAFDALGNLYGTTQGGGKLNLCYGQGCGTVYKLSPGANGKWTETVLHYFNGKDGTTPDASLIFDTAGNLYSTTTGDRSDYGTVFKLAADRNGSWTETVLHRFDNKDGAYPDASLVFDSAGHLYGTTLMGGNLNACSGPYGSGCGVVFEITP